MKRKGLFSGIDGFAFLSWDDGIVPLIPLEDKLRNAVRKRSAGIVVPVVMTARRTLRHVHIENLMSVIKYVNIAFHYRN